MSARMRWLLGLGGGLVLLVNAIALGGVAWNRSGVPEATVVLGQRELALPWRWGDAHDNSGLALALRWRVPVARADQLDGVVHDGAYAQVEWLDAAKLETLGFERPTQTDDVHRPRALSREVWLALELAGTACARALQRAEAGLAQAEAALAEAAGVKEREERVKAAREALRQEREEHSRLFVVDADLDAAALRARWPDRSAHLILRGRVRPDLTVSHPAGAAEWRWVGHVEAVSIDQIHVPLAHRAGFESVLAMPWPRADARYAVTLAYGRRHEPWITAATFGAGD
jgi:hypothetical protein